MSENEISKGILDAAFKVHTALGPGLLESAYEKALQCTHPVKTVRLRGDEDGSVQATTVVATVAA